MMRWLVWIVAVAMVPVIVVTRWHWLWLMFAVLFTGALVAMAFWKPN